MKSYYKPIKCKNVILIDEFSDYSIIFNELTAESMGLNPLGLNIWNEIDGKKSVHEIAGMVCEKFDVSYDKSIRDTGKFIKKLYRRLFVSFACEDSDFACE